MKRHVVLPIIAMCAAVLFAHPMGNFSVSHYSRIELTANGARIRYILDLAGIPTVQLLQQWKLEASAPREELERRAVEQARVWSRSLKVEVGGQPAAVAFERASMTLDKGGDGMPVLRVVSELRVDAAPGALRFEAGNSPARTGWKEIVIVAGNDAIIDRATPNTPDRSRELTSY